MTMPDEDTRHVVPVDDLIEHDDSDECVCGPRVEIVQRDDAPDGYIVVHHALDGRDQLEHVEAPMNTHGLVWCQRCGCLIRSELRGPARAGLKPCRVVKIELR